MARKKTLPSYQKRESDKPGSDSSSRTLTVEKENQIYKDVFDEISRFTALIARQELEIQEAETKVTESKVAFENAKEQLRDLQQARDGSKHGLYRFLCPVNGKFLPLFDRMEPADEDLHGEGSTEWRKEPVAAIGISLPAQIALNAADILFVGQLQDCVMNNPAAWFESMEGLSAGAASAIVDSLNDFIAESVAPKKGRRK
jgi:hypothetical protein